MTILANVAAPAEVTVEAYLSRIGTARPGGPDAAALRDLHRAHLTAVPYNTLAIHLGEEVPLDERSLLHNLVTRRRGGLCYELNGAFAILLESLGYTVDLLPARVYAAGRLALPFSHIALRVTDSAGFRWLADVGFGKHMVHPLALDTAAEQHDPGGRFQVVETPDGDLDVLRAGRLTYRVDPRARELGDFEGTCWWIRTSPLSPYARGPVCSRLLPDGGRVTLSGRTLVTTPATGGPMSTPAAGGPMSTPAGGGGRSRRELAATEVLDAYREYFGLVLDREPARPA